MADIAARLEALGVAEKAAAQAAGSKAALSGDIAACLDAAAEHAIQGPVDGNLLVRIAMEVPGQSPERRAHRLYLVSQLAKGGLHKNNLAAAIAFVKKVDAKTSWPGEDGTKEREVAIEKFETECGVGVTVSDDDARAGVREWFEANAAAEVTAKGGWDALGRVLGHFRSPAAGKLRWADPLVVKAAVDESMEALLGKKEVLTKEEAAARRAEERRAAKAKAVQSKAHAAASGKAEADAPPLVRFPPPEENTQNKPDILAAHLKRTGGRVRCRFPPEPNGYLHIGHAKSMNLNFSYPRAFGGTTNLRFDDTNPEAEKQEYIDSIQEDLAWLGWKPDEVNFSSDHFDQLHTWAVQLIKEGKAYVCHQNADEIKRDRELKKNSPWRDTPIEENLRKFNDMRLGKYEEGTATLRLKMDMQSDVTTMRDLVAYRIKYIAHPHAGDKWCIYPSYDYTHCLIDSIEDITHSLCTLEFVVRRDSYYWLLDALNLYKPVVWEYSRLNLTHTVLSKRKLITLVTAGIVKGWDDPRMPTISGFRRRGYTPSSINEFCRRVGVTRHDQEIDASMLEECCREDLNENAPRRMCVLDPVRIRVRNWAPAVAAAASSSAEGNFHNIWRGKTGAEIEKGVATLGVANHPAKDVGEHSVDVTSNMFISREDFREVDEKGYKRLAPGATVGLSHLGATLTAVSFTSTGAVVTEIVCDIDFCPSVKARGYVHWVCAAPEASTPAVAEVRLYESLFRTKTPGALSNEEFLSFVNTDSLRVVSTAYVDRAAAADAVGAHAQFERVGFFVCDKDSDPRPGGKRVWNRVVPLKAQKWEGKP